MDLRYETALSHATKAWTQNRMTDPLTLQHLKRGPESQHNTSQPAMLTANNTPEPPPQPALATFGNLGTRLNLFA